MPSAEVPLPVAAVSLPAAAQQVDNSAELLAKLEREEQAVEESIKKLTHTVRRMRADSSGRDSLNFWRVTSSISKHSSPYSIDSHRTYGKSLYERATPFKHSPLRKGHRPL